MLNFFANSSRGQLKIQQMAFVLVAIMIFFGMAALFYFSISGANLQEKAKILRDNEARALVQKMAGSPELTFTSEGDCESCIDLDKAIVLQSNKNYKDFWNIDYLEIERIYPANPETPCTTANYPNCNKIIFDELTNQDNSPGAAWDAYVTLVRWVPADPHGYFNYEIGKIRLSMEEPDAAK